MGFGFNFLIILVVFPVTLILLVLWIFRKNKKAGKWLLFLWGGIFSLVFLALLLAWFNSPMQVDRDEIYGSYVIDRTKFPGEQADWQYNHFRFEVRENDSIYFYETEEETILHTRKGAIGFVGNKKRPRLKLKATDSPRHHILSDNPTLYRQQWGFYYVFWSPKFRNVFFTKGNWEPLN